MKKPAAKKKAENRTPQNPSLNHAITSEITDTGSMDQIRDILFGNQMREFEKRFKRMEEHLFKEISGVRDSSQKRLETMEAYFKKELMVLKERLQNEIEDRAEAEKKSLREFNDATSSLGRKIAKMEENITSYTTDFHDQLLTQSKNITADMDNKFEKSANDTKEAFQELSDIKADRSMLAELFMQFAIQFSSEQAHEITAQKAK